MCSRALSNAFATTCCSMVHTMFAGTYITAFFIMAPNVDGNVGKNVGLTTPRSKRP